MVRRTEEFKEENLGLGKGEGVARYQKSTLTPPLNNKMQILDSVAQEGKQTTIFSAKTCKWKVPVLGTF